MREQPDSRDAVVAVVAARQHGVVSVAQLSAAGLTRSGVTRRVRAGRLHRVHRGVYAVGHAGLSNEGRWAAAVLACGAGAVLSHRPAAELWGLLPARQGPVDITVRSSNGRSQRPGIRLHRSPSLPAGAVATRSGIRVTFPARTLADLRRAAPPTEVRRAIRQAEYLGFDLGETVPDHTRSELERSFLRLCRRYRLPTPEVNAVVGPFTVDFLWRGRRLVVETDGYAAHRGRQAFEDDRERELQLGLLGYRMRRFSQAQVTARPAVVARALRALLAT